MCKSVLEPNYHVQIRVKTKYHVEIITKFAKFALMDVINDIFNLTDKQPAPVAGAVLVAKPTVDDLCFKRGVILLVNHNAHDSMGLMVNYEAGYLLHEVIPGIDCEEEIPVYIGGPVDTERLFYIHTLGPDIIPRSREIAGGIYIGGDYDAVKAYVNSGATVDGKIKFLVGYSGWSAGQLDAEIRRHDWAVDLNPSRNIIMRYSGDEAWRKAVAHFGDRYRMWLNWPNSNILN